MTTFMLIHRTDRPVRLGGNASRLLLALVAAVVIVAQPQPVLAHAFLVRTSPAQAEGPHSTTGHSLAPAKGAEATRGANALWRTN